MNKTRWDRQSITTSLMVSLSLLLLTAPAWVQFIRIDALPCTHDNAFHYFRITAMRDALRHGWLFSRWLPNLALGYGYPFFNYREPLPYLIGELFFTLGLPLPLVLGIFYAASIFLAALGSYILVRDIFGPRAAWVTAIAYSMAPYLLLDAYRRGNLPESIALALLPWIFLNLRRLTIYGRKKDFTWSVILLATLFLTHNISSLLLVPFLGGFILFYTCLHRTDKSWRWAFAAVGVAVLLTAWFWLPAVLEQDMVQLNLSHTTRNNDYHYNFISWRQILLTPSPPFDPQYLNPPMRIYLGLGQGLLAILGLLAAVMLPRSKEQRGVILLALIFAIGYLWMATDDSVFVWNNLPFLTFVQFPWRLVGRALLPVTWLAGSLFSSPITHIGVGDNEQYNGQKPLGVQLMVSLAVGGLVLSTLSDTYPPKGLCVMERFPEIADVTAYEKQGFLGMDPEQSYFPVWVEEHPAETLLAEAFAAGNLPQRLDLSSLPEDAVVISERYRVLSASIRIKSSQAFTLRWKGLYFPGWRARIDGKLVQIAPEDDSGLITITMPPGEHLLTLRFGLTPIRAMGIGMAILGAITLAVMLFTPTLTVDRDAGSIIQTSSIPLAKALMLMAVLLLMARFAVAKGINTPAQRSRIQDGRLPDVEHVLDQKFGDHMVLLGYNPPVSRIKGDGELQVDILWQAAGQPGREYLTTVLVAGQDGQSWSPAGTLRPSGYEPYPSTLTWEEGDYIYDPHIVSLLPGTAPGRYQLKVVVFDKNTLQPLSTLTDDGSLGLPEYSLGRLDVERPASPYPLDSLGIASDMEGVECGPVKLWSQSLDRSQAAPGDVLAVRWVWEMLQSESIPIDTAELTLLDASGSVVEGWNLPLSTDWWPPDNWLPGERWVGRHIVRLPNQLMSGTYTAEVYLSNCTGALASSELYIPEVSRLWEMPVDFIELNALFNDQVQLAGYRSEQETTIAGQTINLDLAWKALSVMDASYRVFVHLVDSEGRIVDQDDGEPVNWTRPTTGWVPGEFVIDSRVLLLPEAATGEEFSIRIGLYREDGVRLQLPSSDDTYNLMKIQVSDDS